MTYLGKESLYHQGFPPSGEEAVGMPDFPYSLSHLKDQGYTSVGIDIIIGHIHNVTGEPSFVIEVCKETEKTFDGQLAHPKETMKRNSKWHVETFDEAVRRCLKQELGADIDTIPLLADPRALMIETDTYVIKGGERWNYKACLFMFWDTTGLGWLPPEVDTDEVKGVKSLSLSDVLSGEPTQFRECTQDIFTLLQEQGYFEPNPDQLKRVSFKKGVTSSGVNGFENIDLRSFPHGNGTR